MSSETTTEKSQLSFSEKEEQILAFWREKRIFERSLTAREGNETYIFYDGPPFATGTPHYGHILASAIKDAVPRYQTMRGKHVPRRWGWDCHGLPIENIVEKDLKISGKKEIEAYGIGAFNRYARSKVLQFVGEWKRTVERMARWVDFDGSYKTMDNTYIESVWWALGELHDKGLVYEGTRVLPYCPRCETPIAQSEIAMDNSYKTIRDLSVVVKFALLDEPNTYLLAWTTTPWTLPGNTAAAVHKDFAYVVAEKDGARYIAAEKLAPKLFDESYTVVKKLAGADLLGKQYKPIFPYYLEADLPRKDRAWRVYHADYVTEDVGSGIVHIAPAFGEEDMALAKEENIPPIVHVGPDGRFVSAVTDFAGELVKPKDHHQATDILIIKQLAHNNVLFAKESIEHAYPHCFRCETPLYYYALPAWFVAIQPLKLRLAELNEQINWVPKHLQHGRFLKSMEAAPDWNISRNRYWASPLPIWKCTACSATRFVRSAEEFRDQILNRNQFYFLRHGQAEKDLQDLIESDELGRPLTEAGKAQIAAVSAQLKGRGITKILSSPVARTRESAEIVGEALGISVEFDDRLAEMDFGDFHGKNIAEWRAYVERDEDHWLRGAPNGETWFDVQRRMIGALEEYNSRYKDEKILIVSHGDPLYVLFLALAGVTELVGPKSSVEYPQEAELRTEPVRYFDLHRPYIDDITFSCACGQTMQRVPEVFDCWLESGAMPFAAQHYPFENQEWFSKNFPADFVAEYIAQTRTWFYYMHVLATSIFDSVPFTHVVTTGTILAEDGQKMSKSKNNFPDPWLVFEKYGVDALRFHLLGSSLLKAEDMNFSERELDEVFKKHILRLQNVLAFYSLYPTEGEIAPPKEPHVLDRWVLERLYEVTHKITDAMERYEIDQAVRPIGEFIDDLSVWYVRRSRERMKDERAEISLPARQTLRYALHEFAKVIAPFIPFSAELIYQAVTDALGQDSVHLLDWPTMPSADPSLLSEMGQVRKIVELGHARRNEEGIRLRQPLAQAIIAGVPKLDSDFEEIICDELNVKTLQYTSGAELAVALDTTLTPELEREGLARELSRQIQALRKASGFAIGQEAVLTWKTQDSILASILADPNFAAGLSGTHLEQGNVPDDAGEIWEFHQAKVIVLMHGKH